jgi:hypothetical protein
MSRWRTWVGGGLVPFGLGCLTALAQPVVVTNALPPMPVAHAPVAFFRHLLAAPTNEVERFLAGRSPEQRKIVREKINEYRLLPPPLREWRLKATELRWYLTPLMSLPAESRHQLLQTVPEEDRPLVEARLDQWDRLSAAEQRELLDNELALKYVARPNSAPTPSPEQLKNLSVNDRKHLEEAIAQWRSLPEERRQALADRFSSFFNLTKAEQARTLDLFTASEREQLQGSIRSFASLPPAERARCLQSLRQFSRMSTNERLVFLQGAERWKSLSDDQRDVWRRLVNKLPPTPPVLPPLPPGFKPAPPGADSVTPPKARALAAVTR